MGAQAATHILDQMEVAQFQCQCIGRNSGVCGINKARKAGPGAPIPATAPASLRPPTTAPRAPARVSLGDLVGEQVGEVVSFGGLPFAAPPVGPLRFLRPQPPVPWQSELDCTTSRPASERTAWPVQWLSAEQRAAGVVTSEDCLHLNVWAPASAWRSARQNGGGGGQARCPVLVVLACGGRVAHGSAHAPSSSGHAYAERGVVCVAVNYRVGALGFLCPDGGDHNCGIWDQIAALRWVRAEIAAFGGDPENITIMGQSAAADACLALCVSPAAAGLFRRAIMQSPSSFSVSREQAREITREFASACGLSSSSLQRMQGLPAETLLREQLTGSFRLQHGACPGWRGTVSALPEYSPPSQPLVTNSGLLRLPNDVLPFPLPVPVIDHELLQDQPLNALARGAAASLELLIGCNRDEAAFWPLAPESPNVPSWDSLAPKIFDDMKEIAHRIGWEINASPGGLTLRALGLRQQIDNLLDAYEAERTDQPCPEHVTEEQWLHDRILSDMVSGAVTHLACARASRPGNSRAVFRYQFDGYGGQGNALHGSELELTLGRGFESVRGRTVVRSQWLDSWAAFARTGNPNTAQMQGAWRPFEAKAGYALHWDGIDGWSSSESHDRDHWDRPGLRATCRLWEELWRLETESVV